MWLASEGWVYPTYYSSMTVEEIAALDAAANKGKTKNRTWKDYSTAINKFDKKLVYRKHGPIDAANDKGPVLMPKMLPAAGVVSDAERRPASALEQFAAFLGKSPDRCFLTKEFVAADGPHGAEPRALHDFIKSTKFTLDAAGAGLPGEVFGPAPPERLKPITKF